MEVYYYLIKFKIFLPVIKLISFLFKNETNFKTKDYIYQVPLNFDPISKFLMKFDLYEKKERVMLQKMLDNTDIIEAGAGIGLISMYLKKKSKNKKLIMIEPNQKMNNLIHNNFNINKFNLDELEILNYALSDSEKEKVEFQTYESDMANTISNQALDYNFKKKNVDYVDTISLNYIIEKYQIKNFQLVLDIEGEEINVIKKNNAWLDKCASILLENHLPKKDLNELNSYILNKGFSLIDKKENVFLFIKS